MSWKTSSSSSKICCERFKKHIKAFHCSKNDKTGYRPVKKLIPSRILGPNTSNDAKSCSASVISDKRPQVDSRKITKSDFNVGRKRSPFDFCAKCGDTISTEQTSEKNNPQISNTLDNLSHDLETCVSITEKEKHASDKRRLVQQYYKNENFRTSCASIRKKERKKILDPITETKEVIPSSEESLTSNFEVYSNSVEEIGFLDPNDVKNIQDLKEFRKNNYFECHSAKSRISSKGSVTSLTDHKCLYRFYLNDRLFPVPLSTDHQNNIRCVECHLPLDENNIHFNSENSINGTVQAKVKLGNEVQDMILMLPVKKPLIIQEKRKLKQDEDVVYFGIVKLNFDGDSMFNRTLPNNSLALKYQKGYREMSVSEDYQYEKVDNDDIIVI